MAQKATLINSAGKKVVVDAGTSQAQNYFSQGYKLMGAPTVSNPVSSTPKAPAGSVAINGATYNTKEKQQAAYTNITPVGNTLYGVAKPVSVVPENKVSADKIVDTSAADALAKAQAQNKTLAEKQTDAGTAASTDAFSTSINQSAANIRAQLTSTFTPEEQAANKTSLLNKQKEITDFNAATNKKVSDVGFNPNLLTSQVGLSQRQIEADAALKSTALSAEETNLINMVNLSDTEKQQIINGESSIADMQVQIQTHIDKAKADVLTTASAMSAEAQQNLATAITAYKGIDVDKMTAEQTANLTKLATDAGLDPQLVIQGIKAVNAQQTLDNKMKQDQLDQGNWASDPTTGQLYNKKTGEVRNADGTINTPANGGEGVVTDATGNSYDISSYSTDPNHEVNVKKIMSSMGQFKTVSDIDNYIKKTAPNSPVTGQMIADSAQKYGVSWEAMTAIMQQDSSLGTKGKAVKTFNPGNVGNDDSGNLVNYGNWQSGVDAVGAWLGKHKVAADSSGAGSVASGVGNDILSKTGLSILAYNYLTQGVSSLTRLNQATRAKITAEAENFVKSKGVDYETFQSQYKTYNDVLSQNMKRFNNTKIMESELTGTLDNLSSAITDADLKNVKAENVAKIWAGEQVNDPQATKVAFHTLQLRNEMAGYFAATQGKTSPDVVDNNDAALAIQSGLSAGSVEGLKQAIQNSTVKMGAVLQGSVDNVQNQVRGLFGVEPNAPTADQKPVNDQTTTQVNDYLNSLPSGTSNTTVTPWYKKFFNLLGL